MHQIAKLTFILLPSFAAATEDDLWITEVIPATGQIEVTNVGEDFTTTRSLPFCHRFNYSTGIPSGTVFAAGESQIFTVTFANSSASDLWLYQPGGFGNAANIISGLQWNTSSNIGRSNLASTVSRWNGGTASAPGPVGLQSIQLTGDNPFFAENWTVGEPNLGVFGEVEELEPETPTVSIQRDGENFILTWVGGAPPYQVLTSDDLTNFEAVGGVTSALTATVPRNAERQFFQVVSMAELPQTARFRVTYSSLWSGLTFNMVPTNPTLGDLVGGTHNADISFWSPGEIASSGVADLANTGNSALLGQEVGFAIASESANQFIAGAGVDQELGMSSFEISVDRDFPLLSLVSRLSDSPDWFTGVENLSLLDDEQNFISRLDIMLMPWDAGADSNIGFGTPTLLTSPREPVRNLSDDLFFQPSFLLGFDVGTIPVAGLVIEQIME